MNKKTIISAALFAFCSACSSVGSIENDQSLQANQAASTSQSHANQSYTNQSEAETAGLKTASQNDHQSGHHRQSHDEPRPYDKDRNAMADVEATLAKAAQSGKKPLLVLGANWCHDSRGLAARFEKEEFISLIQDNYELLYVDVGKRDRNLDVAKRFGIHDIIGTPTVLVLNNNGELLNADTASDWRRAASISDEDTFSYFSKFTDEQ